MPKSAQRPKPIVTPPGRLSYPALFEPSDMDNKYSATIIWPDSVDLTDLENAIQAAIKAKWGDKVPGNLRVPLKDCSEKTDGEGNAIRGYDEGGRFLKAWTRQRPPKVVGKEKDPTTGALIRLPEHEVYGGCWVRLSISLFGCHNPEFKTNDVIANLLNVQKWDDDEPFGGIMSDPDDDFLSDEDVASALE